MRVAVVGLGYVGVTAAACIAEQRHTVIGVDINADKVDLVSRGICPITEPKLDELVASNVAAGRLTATQHLETLDQVDLVVVCVGTPSAPDGSHNMGFILESTRQLAELARSRKSDTPLTVAYRSTFRPGTMDDLISPVFRSALGAEFEESVVLAYNPEFLRESTAVDDYFNPPKIVIGTRSPQAVTTMNSLHEGIDAPVFHVGVREAEITKFVDNAWHAAKVAFANEVGRVAAAYDVDAAAVHEIFVADTKLNISPYYLRPGGAFGGSCLPKDVRAFSNISLAAGVHSPLIDSLIPSNESHKEFQADRVRAAVPAGSRILVAGLAFKAFTDDVRESPAVDLVVSLRNSGYDVVIYDPAISTSVLLGQNLGYLASTLPNYRELLVDVADEADPYDLVVLTNKTGQHLDSKLGPQLDLSSIGSKP